MTPRERIMLDIDNIAQTHGYDVGDILGKSKFQKLVVARRECVLMLRGKGYSTTQIGRIMHRDHSTIVHSLQVLAVKDG